MGSREASALTSSPPPSGAGWIGATSAFASMAVMSRNRKK
jgi:hypothetical protein